MNVVISQLQRGFCIRFLLAVFVTVIIILCTYIHSILSFMQQGEHIYQGYHNDLILDALSSDMLLRFIPVLSALPLASGYIEDVKTKYVRYLLAREGYSGYLISAFTSCWICGGCTLLFGVFNAWGLTALTFTPLERVADDSSQLETKIGQQFLLLFLNGGLWAVLGMTMSTIMESKYIAYISPFIVYYLLVILYERYLPNAWFMYPKYWLDSTVWPHSTTSIAVFLCEITLLSGITFYVRGRRRLESL